MKSTVFVSILTLFLLGADFSLASTTFLPMEIQSTHYVTVAKAHALQKENRLEISGTITRPGEVHLPGHVDLILLGKDGSVLENRRIPVPGLNSNRRGRMDLRFGIALDMAPPPGSRAVLRYHAPGASTEEC